MYVQYVYCFSCFLCLLEPKTEEIMVWWGYTFTTLSFGVKSDYRAWGKHILICWIRGVSSCWKGQGQSQVCLGLVISFFFFWREIGIGRLGRYIYLDIKITCVTKEKKNVFTFLYVYRLVCVLFVKFSLAIHICVVMSIKRVNFKWVRERETLTWQTWPSP